MAWFAFVLAMGPLIYALLVASFVGWVRPDWFYSVAWTSWGAAVIAALATRLQPMRYVDRGACDVRVSETGLALRPNGRDEWTDLGCGVAWAESRLPGTAHLHLEDGRELELSLHKPEKTQALLATVRARPRRLVTRFRATGRGARLGLIAVGTHVFISQIMGKLSGMTRLQALLTLLACFGVVALARSRGLPPRLEVGNDGIKIQRHRHRRFISFDAIEEVHFDKTVLTIDLSDDTVERLEVSRENAAELRAVYHRLIDAKKDFAHRLGEPARVALLDRGGRSLADWREALAKHVVGGDFRRSTLSVDDVEAILAAPNASPEHRIGAAMAMRIADDDDAVRRIRIAAEGSANDELREALLEVAASEAYDQQAAR